MKQLIFLVTIIFCSFSSIQAQMKVIAVVQDDKGVPIPNATIYNSNTHRGVITNKEGRFELGAQSNDNLVIRCLGYKEYKSAAEKLQFAGIVVLKEEIFNINEVTVTPNSIDVISIVKKFRARIRYNYPKRPTVISGIYKEYSLIENEYYGFIQCDVDVFINSIVSFSQPNFKTRVHDYKLFRHPNRENVEIIVSRGHLNNFWIFGYSYLWNYKEYQHSYAGYTTYNGSKLIKIKFHPKQIYKYATQIEGVMFIDTKTYALVFLQYEMLPNEMDFYLFDGRLQKPIKGESKIMFEFDNGYYYPAYVITTQTSMGIVSDWKTKPNDKDTIHIDFVYNFFTKNVTYKSKSFNVDGLSFDNMFNNVGKDIFEQSKDYKSDFILETKQEKQLFQPY